MFNTVHFVRVCSIVYKISYIILKVQINSILSETFDVYRYKNKTEC